MKTLRKLPVYKFTMFFLMFSIVFNPLLQVFKFTTQAATPPTATTTFTVLAAGARASVLNPTTGNNTTDNNGTAWYYDVSTSMGFAPSGSTVSLNNADTANQQDPLRISWHTSGSGNLNPGYRAGANNNIGSDWNRYIYQSDNIPNYYPYGPQTNVDQSSLTGWTLCYSGNYSQTIALTTLWSQCTGNYLLYAASPAITPNLIDVKLSGSSILNSPGGWQIATPNIYSGNTVSLSLSQNGNPLEWTHYIVYVSNCLINVCFNLYSPLSNPSQWDSGTVVTNGSYTIPSSADYKYLTVYVADDQTGVAVDSGNVMLNVAHTPIDRTVSNCDELQAIQGPGLGDHYTQTDNINCAATTGWNIEPSAYDGHQGFMPLGNVNYRFTGTYDGQGHSISNLYIHRTNIDYVGLFGVIDEGASVSNVKLINADVTGGNKVGALAGGLSGTVTNCSSTGIVNGYEEVGGLVGEHITPDGIGSSSPLLYTWDGSKYQYVADVGRSLPRNVDGSDYTPIDASQLVAKDNKYSVKISEEYNEIVYYDELALTTIDHAPGLKVATSMVRGTDGQYFTYAENPSNPLLSCTDKYNNNCLESLKASDDQWSYKDTSNLNFWTLNFGNLAGAQRIQLVVQGARDYSIATPADSVRYVKVKDANGNWKEVYSSSKISAPSGAPLTRVIDLTGKFTNNNYDVQVAFDTARLNYVAVDTSTQQPITTNTIHPTSADLSFRGFTAIDKTFFWDHDYSKVSPTPTEIFAKQGGYFTKYGDVNPLLQSTNDQFVVMAPGDHMDINFDYTAPAEGKERSYVMYSYVTYKHASKDTGRTVDPLPFKGMTKYPYTSPETYPTTPANIAYIKDWNTRFITGSVGGSSTIINSYSSANVNGYYELGGLVGYNDKLITGSHSIGNISLLDTNSNYFEYVGGLVGYNDYNGQLINSYSSGNISAVFNDLYSNWSVVDEIGGLVGENDGSITNSQSSGDINLEDSNSSIWNQNHRIYEVGGLVGYNNGEITDSISTGNIAATFSASVINNTNGSYYDINEIGGFVGYNDYNITNSYSTGNVTVLNNSTADDNSYLNNYINEIGGFAGYSDGSIVGSHTEGVLNVSNASVLDETENHQYNIDGIGGFVGENSSDIASSYTSVDVTESNLSSSNNNDVQGIGGFAGYNYGDISKSFSSGNTTGDLATESSKGASRIGGFIGMNEGGTITESYSTGNISGGQMLGGFVGMGGGTFQNDFSRGSVTGNIGLGSFAGSLVNTSITLNSYATGAVIKTGTSDIVAGFTSLLKRGTITNSFWDNQTTGMSVSCSQLNNANCNSVFGKTTLEMKTKATFTTALGDGAWSFDGENKIWGISPTLNDGYPFLLAFNSDQDSISNVIENAAPNLGDANNDGTPDSQQPNVASFVNEVTGQYTVLAAPEGCTVQNVDIHPELANAVQDSGFNYLSGLLGYTISCTQPGMTAEINLYFYGVSPSGLVLRKFNNVTNGYATISGAVLSEVTIDGLTATKVTYSVVDGGVLDMDGQANGVIIDPVGLGTNVVRVPNTGLGGGIE